MSVTSNGMHSRCWEKTECIRWHMGWIGLDRRGMHLYGAAFTL